MTERKDQDVKFHHFNDLGRHRLLVKLNAVRLILNLIRLIN